MTPPELRDAVHRLLASNTKEGYSKLLGQHYCYIAPALKTYPFQWFWDTCFHVIILTCLGEHELAKRNLRSLFAQQENNGFVGHMIFWQQLLPQRHTDILQARPSFKALRPHMSALIQPPLAATALLRLFQACQDRVYLGELYARIKRHHEWLALNRDFDGDGLLTIISPFESGMDWKASYDPVLGYRQRVTPQHFYTSPLSWKGIKIDWYNFLQRYDLERIKHSGRFLIKDAGVNAIYAMDLQAMEQLATIIGDDATPFAQRRRRVVQSLLKLAYDPQDCAFYDIQEPGGKKLRTLTPTIFFPLMAPEIGQDIATRLLAVHFDNHKEFNVRFPIPTVNLNAQAFFAGETPFIWRGPTWAFINWFVYLILKNRGFEERAEHLRQSLWRLVEKSGFREYYDPLTGAGYGAYQFTWSGLLLDMT